MKPTILLKSAAAEIFARSGGVHRQLRSASRQGSLILTYHRILPRDGVGPEIQPGMYVEAETFERQVGFLRERFTIVPLSCIGNGTEASNQKPVCALTFDDGWRDFHEFAYPVLKAWGVPATVFLPTDFIGTERWFWTDRLGSLLLRLDRSQRALSRSGLSGPSATILGFTGSFEVRLEKAISFLKLLAQEQIEETLEDLASLSVDEGTGAGRAFLTWEEIREMARSGLITFGSHTAGHRILTTTPLPLVREELLRSRAKLLAEEVAEADFLPFCYPNGDHTPEICRLVEEAGYHMAVTTQSGWNGAGADRFALRRIPLHQDMTSTIPLFSCRIAGLF